ncbi:MAG: polyphenol oxidase family protein [Candidatus Eisenbacteria bacterium]
MKTEIRNGFFFGTFPALEETPGFAHGVIGRSETGAGREAALDPFLPPGLCGERTARIRQVHGARVIALSGGDPLPEGEEADAVVTDLPGVTLRIRVADCMPLFLADRDRGVIALAHAGWRGLAGGVVEETSRRFRAAGGRPDHSEAFVGPSIGPCCYLVGPEVVSAFAARARITPGARSHSHLDLFAIAGDLLLAHGFPRTRIGPRPPCTACEAARWHSHRAGRGAPGRNLAYFAILP